MERPTSLHIKKFKCFEDLKLETVGAVNLIAGKNNVGKSTLLEAVAVCVCGTDPSELFRVLDAREKPISELQLASSFARVFHEGAAEIILGLRRLVIRFPAHEEDKGNTLLWTDFRSETNSNLMPSFSLKAGAYGAAFDLSFLTRNEASAGRFEVKVPGFRKVKYQWVTGSDWMPDRIRSLWDGIYGLAEEEELVALLQILDPTIIKIILPTSREQTLPRVRRSTGNELEPLSRFGEGLTRLFNLGLAMLNAKDGVLLVDEIESGLHHTLYPKLWKFLFETAEKLNVTVFATTHSHDATASFSKRAIMYPSGVGVLSRLEESDQGIVAVQYGVASGLVAAEEGYEVR